MPALPHTVPHHFTVTNLYRIRCDHGLSQRAMAEELGVHHTYISRLENGFMRCSPDVLERIASRYDVDADWILAPLTIS